MQLSVEAQPDCAAKNLRICDTTPYSPLDSVERNVLVYDCNGKIKNAVGKTDQYCIAMSGVFVAGDIIYITPINGITFGYMVLPEDIVQPSAPRISQDTANQYTYTNIANKLLKVIQANSDFCGNDLDITVNTCNAACILSIKSLLPGIKLGITAYVELAAPDTIDLCLNATDLAIESASTNLYQVFQGNVYVYLGIYYYADANSPIYDITLNPPALVPELISVTCPYLQPIPRINPPSVTATNTQAATPNMGQNLCLDMPITEDAIYTIRLSSLVSHPRLYKQVLTITGGTPGTVNQVIVFPPSPPLPGLNLATVYSYSQATSFATAKDLSNHFNQMVKLSGINTSYVWSKASMNTVEIYILAQSFLITDMNFSKLDSGDAVSTISVASEVAAYTEVLEGKFTIGLFCWLDMAIRKNLMDTCGSDCLETQAHNAFMLQSRKSAIEAFLCEGNIPAACKLMRETKLINAYKNGCGC